MKAVAAILLCSFLTLGCSFEHPTQAMFTDYQNRLAKLTQVETKALNQRATPSIPMTTLPRRRDRALPLSEIRIGLWDYLQIYECRLNQLVGQRNSSLGKVMPASQRLVYETQLVYEMTRCLTTLKSHKDEDTELIRELEQALEIKRSELHLVAWNAFIGSQEFENLTSLSTEPLEPADPEPLIISRQALDELLRTGVKVKQIQENPTVQANIEADRLEANLLAINTQRSVGRLLKSIELVSNELGLASSILQQARTQNSLCPQGKQTREADYLKNVFSKYYVGRIQPYLSMLNREGQALLESVDKLLALYTDILPESFQTYQASAYRAAERIGNLAAVSKRTIMDHTKAWQALLATCNIQPVPS